MTAFVDLLAAALLVLGAFFCFTAALGLVRFPDVMTRLHGATKPQVFGLILVLAAVTLTLRSWHVAGLALLIGALQILTAPVSGHMVSRTAHRTGQWNSDDALVDELSDDLANAGFVNVADPATLGRGSRSNRLGPADRPWRRNDNRHDGDASG